MRKRDRLRLAFRSPGEPSPPPPKPARSTPSIAHATSLSQASQSSVTAPTPNALSVVSASATYQNDTLQKAIEQYIATIPQEEKQHFLTIAHNLTDDTVLEDFRLRDQQHKDQSLFRSHLTSVSRFLQGVGRFTDAIAIGIQANPDVSSIIVGLARGLVTIAIDFASFFDKLTDLMNRMTDYLGPFTEYAQSARHFPVVETSLLAVYVDLLTFLRSARRVFVDNSGSTRSWTSWRVFWRVQWVPFQEEFGVIETSMKHHLNVLHHAAQAVSLDKSHELSQAELLRRRREAGKNSYNGCPLILPKVCMMRYTRKAGIGKSVLASAVIEHVTSKRALDDDVGVAFFYYDYRLEESRQLSFVLCALTKQICRMGQEIHNGFLKVKQDALPPSQLGNLDTFVEAVQFHQLHEVFLVIDALDECPRRQRPDILAFLDNLDRRLDCLKLFVTSRSENDIEEAFTSRMKTPYINIEAKSVQVDIHHYITEETQRLRRGSGGRVLHIEDPELEAEIVASLTARSDGMFLWVNLQLNHLCEESQSRDDQDVRKALATLPSDLNATYERIVHQMLSYNTRRQKLAFSALRWIMYAQRTLTFQELEAILLFSETGPNGRTTQKIDKQFLLSSCANLLEVSGWEQTVNIIHYSVYEYLATYLDPRIGSQLRNTEKELQHTHTVLSTACMSYLIWKLSSSEPEGSPFDLRMRLVNHSFLWYAARFFDVHLDQSTKDSALLDLVKVLLQQHDRCLASILQVRAVSPSNYSATDHDTYDHEFDTFERTNATVVIFSTKLYGLAELFDFWKGSQLDPSLLQRACSAGVLEAVEFLLKSGHNVNAKNKNGISPMYAAVTAGHIQVVLLLLTYGAEVNCSGGFHGQPLQAAAAHGNKDLVLLLLDRGAQVRAQGGEFGSALQAAALGGYDTIMQLLIDRGADVNVQKGKFGNVLMTAANSCCETTMQLLLDNGADITRGDRSGNVLHTAVSSGHEPTVRLLLDRGADINAQGGVQGNALQVATIRGNKEVIRLLVDKGADINAQCGHFGNALCAAVCAFTAPSDEGIIQLLLDKGADVNAKAKSYSNALAAAAHRGLEKVIRLLIDSGANVNAQGGKHGTALEAAICAEDFKEEIVHLLLDEGADVNGISDSEYHTALNAAIDDNREQAVRLLLGRGADVNLKVDGRNALGYARKRWRSDGIIDLLLAHGAQESSDPESSEDDHSSSE